jgi:hypothetical protein
LAALDATNRLPSGKRQRDRRRLDGRVDAPAVVVVVVMRIDIDLVDDAVRLDAKVNRR